MSKTKKNLNLPIVLMMLCTVLLIVPRPVLALCTRCEASINSEAGDLWEESEANFDRYLDREFQRLQNFVAQRVWAQGVLPVIMDMATEITMVAMYQTMIIGMFIDAENQLTAQRLLQEMQAETHKRYHPSIGVCEFGSVSKSLGATEIRSEAFAVVLSKRSIDRQMGMGATSGSTGGLFDKKNRMLHFGQVFCNEKDRASSPEYNRINVAAGVPSIPVPVATGLTTLCAATNWDAGFDAEERARLDKDIDYFLLMDQPWTMNIDFTNNSIQTASISNEDEEHVLAMNSNLFAHELFPRIPANALQNKPREGISPIQRTFMDMRSIIAKRSVAENSFYSIAALKSEGYRRTDPASGDLTVPSAKPYMAHVMEDLGVPAAEVDNIIGDNPSYFAQMEILTKKLYQSPHFYTNLYDKPANVERKAVALQAVKLMQKFDMLRSFLRNEATVSVLLEVAVVDLQNEIEDQIKSLTFYE